MNEVTGLAGAVPTQPVVDRRASVWLRLAWHLPFVIAGLALAFEPTLLSRFRLIETDLGDTRLVNFIFEHGYRWIAQRFSSHPVSLWDQPFFFPTPNVGAYSEVLLGSAPIYWIYRATGFAPDTSLQLWMISVLVLDYVAMGLFLRRCLDFGHLASAVGAFLFAFASPRVVQMGHQQLLPQFFTVFALYGLYRFFRPARMTTAQGLALFAFSFAAQLWAGFYLGWFLFLALLVMTVWALSVRVYRVPLLTHVIDHWKDIAFGIATILVLLAPMAVAYVRALHEVGPRVFWAEAQMIQPQSWFYLGPGSWLYGWQMRLAAFQAIPWENEKRLGIGWVTIVVATCGFVAFARRRGAWSRVALLSAGAIILLMTLYRGGFAPWRYVGVLVPAAGAARAVSRVILLLLVPFAVGLAYAVQTVRSRAVALLLCATAVVEQRQYMPAYDKLAIRSDIAAAVSRIGRTCGAFYYVASCSGSRDAAQSPFKLHIDAMWAALESGVPTVNGYSGNAPRGWWPLTDDRIFDDGDRMRLHEALQQWNASHKIDDSRVCWVESASCR